MPLFFRAGPKQPTRILEEAWAMCRPCVSLVQTPPPMHARPCRATWQWQTLPCPHPIGHPSLCNLRWRTPFLSSTWTQRHPPFLSPHRPNGSTERPVVHFFLHHKSTPSERFHPSLVHPRQHLSSSLRRSPLLSIRNCPTVSPTAPSRWSCPVCRFPSNRLAPHLPYPSSVLQGPPPDTDDHRAALLATEHRRACRLSSPHCRPATWWAPRPPPLAPCDRFLPLVFPPVKPLHLGRRAPVGSRTTTDVLRAVTVSVEHRTRARTGWPG
jgi:hypothetical protein